ncbi:MAG: dependent protein [Thermotogaceae bacterium]|jgi:hypothetical protein|nr:dependent protein [Thermotogaceae bacterium]MDN5338274.1 dependent protein [Thermotogaceae bacterium]
MNDLKETISKNIERVLEKIKKSAEKVGRNPDEITLVAVSKNMPTEAIKIAYEAGLRIFGENRAQEAREKVESLKDLDIKWHFIGRLQRNKVKYVVNFSELVHSVDSFELLLEIDKRARKISKVQNILLEVNISGEETKAGLNPDAIDDIVEKALKLENIKLRGFMTMAPFVEDPEEVRWVFKSLRELRDRISQKYNLKNLELSMGMSNDFEVAIEEGATMVRIGTAIFGRRDG